MPLRKEKIWEVSKIREDGNLSLRLEILVIRSICWYQTPSSIDKNTQYWLLFLLRLPCSCLVLFQVAKTPRLTGQMTADIQWRFSGEEEIVNILKLCHLSVKFLMLTRIHTSFSQNTLKWQRKRPSVSWVRENQECRDLYSTPKYFTTPKYF